MKGYFYDHTRKLFANGEINVEDLRVILLRKHEAHLGDMSLARIDRDEVSGNGWPFGGAQIKNCSIEISEDDEATLRGEDIRVTAVAGSIGPTDSAVIAAEEFPLFFITFGEDKIASEGNSFIINWNWNGIMRWINP